MKRWVGSKEGKRERMNDQSSDWLDLLDDQLHE
jgi:hypothetical protein